MLSSPLPPNIDDAAFLIKSIEDVTFELKPPAMTPRDLRKCFMMFCIGSDFADDASLFPPDSEGLPEDSAFKDRKNLFPIKVIKSIQNPSLCSPNLPPDNTVVSSEIVLAKFSLV